MRYISVQKSVLDSKCMIVASAVGYCTEYDEAVALAARIARLLNEEEEAIEATARLYAREKPLDAGPDSG